MRINNLEEAFPGLSIPLDQVFQSWLICLGSLVANVLVYHTGDAGVESYKGQKTSS